MNHSEISNKHYVQMFIIMIVAGLLSTMNIWVATSSMKLDIS